MKEKATCPKCNSENVSEKRGYGGFNVYAHLECDVCHFSGGKVTVYSDEMERVERELRERFDGGSKRDAVKEFVSSII